MDGLELWRSIDNKKKLPREIEKWNQLSNATKYFFWEKNTEVEQKTV